MGPVSSDPGAETRTTAKSLPLALEVPVVATGARPGDQSEKRELFTEETETVLVLEHGAVIHLSAAVAVGQLVFLTNKQTGKEIVTQVLRKRSYRPTACYVELDFMEEAPGFWGVEFSKAEDGAKFELPESGEAAELAEAEVTEEEFGPAVPLPDEADVARLRREVEALKAQLKVQTVPSQSTEIQQPSDIELAALKSLLKPQTRSEEPTEEEKLAVNEAPKPPEATAAKEIKEEAPAFPFKMQLPQADTSSVRTVEFAADSAAITAAIEDHLLPKPSLDFDRFPGVAEPKTKLYSGKATRSLSGPIGVLVAAVLLLVAAGIAAYQFEWWPKFGGKSAKSEANKSAFGPAGGAAPAAASQPEPPGVSNAATADPAPIEKPPAAASSTHAVPAETHESSAAVSPTTIGSSRTGIATSKSSAQPAPEKRTASRTVAPKSGANETATPSVRVEENVIVEPKLIKGRRSLSPPEALRGHISGNVVMDAIVDETGHVQSAMVVSGRKELHQRALDTVKEYLYQPATKNGKPVSVHVEITIQFWYEP